MVATRTPTETRSVSVETTSGSVSPRPTMSPDLTASPTSAARASTARLRGVAGRGPHRPLQPGHRLDVVVEDVGAGREDEVERVGIPLAVRDEGLDGGPGPVPPDRLDRRRDGAGAAVGKVVTRDAGHHGVREPHAGHGLPNPLGLVGVEREGVARVHLAEAAGPRAARAVDHEGRGAVGPALVDVRAAGLLAHRHERERGHRAGDRPVVLAHPDRHPEPRRLADGNRHPRSGVDAGLAQPSERRALGGPRAEDDRCRERAALHDGRFLAPGTPPLGHRPLDDGVGDRLDRDRETGGAQARSPGGPRCHTARSRRTSTSRSRR